MTTNRMTRRRMLGAMGAAGALAALPSCRKPSGSGGGRVSVGLVIPQAGVYAPHGIDMKRGWDLWLERHGGKLGGREVATVVADEGESPTTGVPAVQKLLQGEQVDVLVGIVSSAVALGCKDMIAEAKKLLIVANAGAGAITGKSRTPYIWRSSFTNAQVSSVMGAHLAKVGAAGPVYLLAPDYAAGDEAMGGFKKKFVEGGGQIAGEAKPAFGKTQDYQPFLARIRSSGAKATFCFFSGGEAVAFVKQYAQFGLARDIPLYASGFLTEGSVLHAQGDAAIGIQTTLHYSTELDIPANREFVAAHRAKYSAAPTVFTVQTWDAAAVLDRALGSASGLDGDSLARALESVGSIEDSPRGPWQFDGQSPRQKFYLRKVEKRGSGYVNAVVADLGVTAPVA
ncbi:MAG TPA: ABC transporter substrate-binding protein [Kofleriaceae bacterium]|nr:ABC transporter substrate-binding protein [Kofleriaceae bacterium]